MTDTTASQDRFEVITLDQVPLAVDAIDALISENMPLFMTWESPGNWRWHRLYELYAPYQLCVFDAAGNLSAAANAVPVHWDGTPGGLPGGTDDVIVAAVDGPTAEPTALCVLSVSVVPHLRGEGLPAMLLNHARRAAAAVGWQRMIVPVRPTRKAQYPLIPMGRYARWTRPDGRAFDPWLATHIALGGVLLVPCERSLVIRQPVERWEQITGHPMPAPGAYVLPGGLAPLVVTDDRAGTYTEPNMWVEHTVWPLDDRRYTQNKPREG